ncbi:MAG: ABC transporter substrate-binding protein [Nostoc sp.]|uniref:ABC transporter substrate-binding protein n=1 Tax=Nostoc sp. TaxID=1180 RepID=UPI002FF8C0BA
MPFNINLPDYTFPTPVKILMIRGKYTDPNLAIDTTIDENLIRNLPGAKSKIVEATSRQKLIDALDENEFDILVFAVHSSTLPDGSDINILLTDTLNITIDQIRNQIRRALNRINHPLVLAIFNSCDGLGIDSKLITLGIKIPYLIAIRQRIIDVIAHKFLELLLRFFVNERMSLQSAYQEAQDGLHSLFPGADFLPILCLKQAIMPDLFWPNNIAIFISKLWRKKIARYVGLTLITILTILLSYFIINKIPKQVTQNTPSSSPTVQSKDFITHCKETELDISCGEKSLLEDSPSSDKKLGIKAFKSAFETKNYGDAVKYLENAFNQDLQNYETGIFLENTKVLQQKVAKDSLQIFPVAVVIPTRDKSKSKKGIYSISKAILQGVYNQQKYFNDSNKTNNRLLVVIANDKNDPGKSTSQNGKQILQDGQSQVVAKELIKRNILAIVGPYSSKVAYYTKNIYKDKKIVVMSYANTATKTTYKNQETKQDTTIDLTENGQFFFRVCSKNTEMAKILAESFDSQQYDNLMLFFDDTNIFSGSFGQEFSKYWETKEKQKNKIIMQDYLGNIESEELETKIDDKIKYAQNKKIGIVLCPGAYTQVNNPTNSEEKDIDNTKEILKKYGTQVLIGGCNVVTSYEDTIRELIYRKNIIVVSVPWFYDPKNRNSQFDKWEEIWRQQKVNFQTDSFMRMVLAQDATMVLTEALSKLDGEPSGIKLQQYLANNKFQGITGEISFKGSDRFEDTSKVITPKCELQGCDKKWNGDWEIVKNLPKPESSPRPLQSQPQPSDRSTLP